MAIYHLNNSFISRSSGRSAVQAVAYIAGEKLLESRRNQVADYTNRAGDVVYSKTLISEKQLSALRSKFGESFRAIDVWDALESFEDAFINQRYKTAETREKALNTAQIAQTIVVALPKELSKENCIELLSKFAEKRFTSRGLVVHVAMHEDEGNPHGHLVIARRSISEDGDICHKKDREIVARLELFQTRKLWADLANEALEKAGEQARITEKSFATLGLDLEPSKHRGWRADQLQAMGKPSRIVSENEQIVVENSEKILENSQIILDEISIKLATFTENDLLSLLQKRLGDDASLIQGIHAKLMNDVIAVGEGMTGLMRYTTEVYKNREENAVTKLQQIQGRGFGIVARGVEQLLQEKYSFFTNEQKVAVRGLTTSYLEGSHRSSDQFGVLIGRAGSGKTTTLKAVSALYKSSGAVVIGASLSSAATQNLADDTGIKCRTIDAYLTLWGIYQRAEEELLSLEGSDAKTLMRARKAHGEMQRLEKFQLTDRHVVLVDEAGMIGTEKWEKLLGFAHTAKAKVIAIGDDHQFKAIAAGDFFRKISEESQQVFTLNKIQRQKKEWMRNASQKFSNLYMMEGLRSYHDRGFVHGYKDESQLVPAMVSRYLEGYLEQKDLDKKITNGVMLAFENRMCRQLNAEVRSQLKERGILPKRDALQVRGMGFSAGDVVVLGKNEEIDKQDLSNGMRGTITEVNGSEITLRVGQYHFVSFSTDDYKYIQHGYAMTTHKAQGQTLNVTQVAVSRYMDAQAFYVAMTRHRHQVDVYFEQGSFKDFRALAKNFSRFAHKDLVSDYTIQEKNQPCFRRVQDYLALGREMAKTVRQKEVNWQSYRLLEVERQRLGRTMLQMLDQHQLYIKQASLTVEQVEVVCGLRARPLTRFERKAQREVEQYGLLCQAYRGGLQALRVWQREQRYANSNLEPLLSDHPLGQQILTWQAERNQLAEKMVGKLDLYRPFIKEAYGSFGLSVKGVRGVNERYQLEKAEEVIKRQAGQKQIHTLLANRIYQLDHRQQKLPLQERQEPLLLVTKETWHKDANYQAYLSHLQTRLIKEIKLTAYSVMGSTYDTRGSKEFYGERGEVSLQVGRGPDRGLYYNSSNHKMGGPLTMIADQLKSDSGQEFNRAVQWAQRYLREKPFEKWQRDRDILAHQQKLRVDEAHHKLLRPVQGEEVKIVSVSVKKTEAEVQLEYQAFTVGIKEQLKSNMAALTRQLLDKPSRTGSMQWRFGNKGAISVYVHGDKKGLYSNFETGVMGGPLKMIEDQLRCDHREAFRWACQWLQEVPPWEDKQSYTHNKALKMVEINKQEVKETPQQPAPNKGYTWTQVPAKGVKPPNLKTDKYLSTC
ncbi:MAG: AAA family ATPase [Pseudomonadales bacterium]|nr:AAA family ATPase [Pseudomonadales bacterium]